MLTPLDNFYSQKDEPLKSCLLTIREIILSQKDGIVEEWKYRMPFFCYNGKRFCYLWVHKKSKKPYLGLVDGNKFDHPMLIFENRSRMKILLFEPNVDLPIDLIQNILQLAISY